MEVIKEGKVKEANLLIEAKHHLSEAELNLWAYVLSRIPKKGLSNLGEPLTDFEVEMDLNDFFDELSDAKGVKKGGKWRVIRYYAERLSGMEGKILFEIPLKEYVNTLQKWNLNPSDFLTDNVVNEQTVIVSPFNRVIVKKDGGIKIVFQKAVIPLIWKLRNLFTVYELNEFLRLEGRYSKILFRLFKEWLGKGGGREVKFKAGVEEIGELVGRGEMKSHVLNRKVVATAVREINGKTSLSVEVEPIRRGLGGKIVGYVFTVKVKKGGGKRGRFLNPKKLKRLLENVIPPKKGEFDLILSDNPIREFASGKQEKLLKVIDSLLGLQRINPSIALWYLLHRSESSTWNEILYADGAKEIKNPTAYLLAKVGKEELKEFQDLKSFGFQNGIRRELERIKKEVEKEVSEKAVKKLLSEIKETLSVLTEEEKRGVAEEFYRRYGRGKTFGERVKEWAKKGEVQKLAEVRRLMERGKGEDDLNWDDLDLI
jgi:hypothetical protein